MAEVELGDLGGISDEFLKDEEAAIPKQFESLLDFASRAYRRPRSRRPSSGSISASYISSATPATVCETTLRL